MGENLIFATRGSHGFSLRRGIASGLTKPIFERIGDAKTEFCRVMQFSHDGAYFCFCDAKRTAVVETTSGVELFGSDNLGRTQAVVFSPRDRVVVTYEPFAIYGARKDAEGKERQAEPNLRFWSLSERRLITTMIAQKANSWQPQWSDDESVMLRLTGSELLIYKNNQFERFESKLVIQKMSDFSLSPGKEPYIACFVPPVGGQPAVVHLRKLNSEFTPVANKTFFKCDHVKMIWNCKGNALIVMASVDVDASNKSYYGEQNLHLLLTNGDGCLIPLGKQGPVYSVKWNPNGREFAACYGFMPARVTLYNLKGDPTFDFGEGARNEIFYNCFGNILLLCGFGNISAGNMEFWQVEERKVIVQIKVPNTTLFEWAPDGQHFLTATTTPRLRIDNGYRIWHYSGKLISETMLQPPEELWQVEWRPLADGVYHRFPIAVLSAQEKSQAGLMVKATVNGHPMDKLPAGAISKAGAYVPPHLRKAGSTQGAPSGAGASSKPAMSDVEKKTRALQKKLADIAALKKRLADGDSLEANQLAKIDKEQELLDEMDKLNVVF